MLKDITSFANSRGGIILIGVNEPSDEIDIKKQIVGMSDSKVTSANIERVCTTSIEPRIPNLIITFEKVFEDKEIIIIYIPASPIKPHMVNYNKHRAFYIRHSESSVPMTVQEIRDSVLYSSNIGKSALTYAVNEEIDLLEYFIKDKPAFIFQAIPLQEAENPLDVRSELVETLIRGLNRRQWGYQFTINSAILPTPTLKGIMGSNSRTDSNWMTEIQRNGCIQLTYLMEKFGKPEKVCLYDHYTELIKMFLGFCKEIWESLKIDLPYLMRYQLVNAKGVTFFKEQEVFDIQREYVNERHNISFQDQIKNIGDDLEVIYDMWEEQFFNLQGRWRQNRN